MSPAGVLEMRQEAVNMFYHGFDNYMNVAFPEDEVGARDIAGQCVRANNIP